MTWTLTFDAGRPTAAAMLSRASIGVWEENQISARPARTSATAVSTSIGAWLTKANSNSPSVCADPRGAGPRRGTAARSRERISASDSDASGPGAQVIRRASRALKAWWKESATTATPPATLTTAWTPGITRAARSSTETTVPPSVGGRATTVGFAPATVRSPAYVALPVTMSRASIRVVGRPITRCRDAGFGRLDTEGRWIPAALAVREPKVAERPSGAITRVSRVRRDRAGTCHRFAAAVTSLARAMAASCRAGPYSELTEFEPPVYWFPLVRASASGMSTSTSRASSSSAIIMATAVVTPCPTSTRGSRTTTLLAVVISRTNISSSVPVTRTSDGRRLPATVDSMPSAVDEAQPSGAATVNVDAASE